MQHVLDRLVRSRIAGDSAEIQAELILRPDPGTVAVVDRLPACDACRGEAVEQTARYDTKIKDQPSGMANLCPDHYLLLSPRRLGLAQGQYLIARDELPETVHIALERALAYWEPRLSG